jgi:hypothetical protein
MPRRWLDALVGVFYLAIEPFVRRNWPDALISLTRLQSGRLRDTIASHILAGLAVLSALQVVNTTAELNGQQWEAVASDLLGVGSVAQFLGFLFGNIGNAVVVVMGYCLIVVLLRWALLPVMKGRLWVADSIAVMLAALPVVLNAGIPAQNIGGAVAAAFSYALLLWTFRRFGLLAGATLMIVSALIAVGPPVIPSWWSGRVLIVHAIPVAVGLWALWVILSSRQHRSTESAG